MLWHPVKAIATPTITAGAYTAGKALGGMLTFSDVSSGGLARLLSLVITDKANQKSALDLLLFNQVFTPTADAATIAISAGDMAHFIGSIHIAAADYVTTGAGAAATERNLMLALDAATDNNLYGQLVCQGTPTFASTSDISVILASERYRL